MSNNENEEIELLVKKEDEDDSKEREPNPTFIRTKKERLYWVDALRIFAALSVIFIHSTDVDIKPMKLFEPDWTAHYFYYSILKPCVPIFIMITGLFFLDPNKNITLTSIFKKNILRLFKSTLFWSFYYNAVDELFLNQSARPPSGFRDRVLYVVKYTILGGNRNHLWYINFCIGLYMVAPIFREVIPKRHIAWYIASLNIIFYQLVPTVGNLFVVFKFFPDIGSVMKQYVNTLRLSTVSNYIGYFMLGYLLNTQQFTKPQVYIFYVVGVLGYILTPTLMFSASHFKNEKSHNFAGYNDFNVAMQTIGIFMFFKYTLSKYVTKFVQSSQTFKKWLVSASECSFGIYLIHMTVYHILQDIGYTSQSTSFPIIHIPIYSCILFCLCHLIIYFMRKVSIFRQIT